MFIFGGAVSRQASGELSPRTGGLRHPAPALLPFGSRVPPSDHSLEKLPTDLPEKCIRPGCVPGVSLRTVRWGGTLLPSGNRAGDGMACNSDDRRQWRKQGEAVGAAASRMQGPPKGRSRRWVPQPVFVSEEKLPAHSPLHFYNASRSLFSRRRSWAFSSSVSRLATYSSV